MLQTWDEKQARHSPKVLPWSNSVESVDLVVSGLDRMAESSQHKFALYSLLCNVETGLGRDTLAVKLSECTSAETLAGR